MKQGWEIKKLGEVIEIRNGKSQKEVLSETGQYPIMGSAGNIMGYATDYICEEGTTIIGRKGNISRPIFIKEKFWNVDTAFGLYPKDSLPEKFVYYTCTNIDFGSMDRGTTIPSLVKTELLQIPILVPKLLTEQKRIVTILDKAFAAIAKAKANAEQNLINAKELFESYLQGVFENKGDGWEEKTLGEVCNIIGGGTPSKKKKEFYNGDILWATVRDMKSDIIKDTEHKITKDAVKNSSTNIIPKENVIIATRVGLGKVCILQNDTAINQDLKGIIPKNQKTVSIDFLFRWFKSNSKKIIDEGTGATVQGVKLPFIKSLVVHLPPLTEQQTIVKKLDTLSAETRKLEAIYQQKLEDLEELKKSVLQKAFNGELT